MQAVEVAYELRDCADYIIGSPSEIPGTGAPQSVLISSFFKKENFAIEIAKKYYEAYAQNYNEKLVVGTNITSRGGVWVAGVSSAVIYTDALKQLALTTKKVLAQYITNQEAINTSGIMRYNMTHSYFDFDGFIASLCGDNSILYDDWRLAFE